MTWTLWRGDDRLGALYERSTPHALPSSGNERHVNAVLIADPVHLPLPSIRQHVIESAGSRHVIERAREIEIAAAPRQTSRQDEPAEVAFPISAAEHSPRRVVSRSRQLQVRDDAGGVVATDDITVLEYRIDPGSLPADLASLPRDSVVDGTIWLVAFTQGDPGR